MAGVLTGFAIIGVVILVGYLVGRFELIGAHGPQAISRLVFFVLNPCLLVTVLADADVHRLFSALFVITSVAAIVAFAAAVLALTLVFRRRAPEALLAGAAAAYENAGNIGLPVAAYVLGNAAYSVPVMLFQLVIFQPLLLAALDTITGERRSLRRAITRPFVNPLFLASVVGVLISVFDLPVPDAVLQPFAIIGGAAVPLVLIGFGISLRGQRPLRPGTGRTDVAIASFLKLVVMPVLAWVLGALVFHLERQELFAVVLLAGLPSAQNVFVFAQRYGRGLVVVRDTVLVTTIGSVPILVLAAALLA
ncbi:AEC family transporter [Galbitalea sp. SE-J8]|uniref:AEC family transporter n=1 Tax=Galbitalea sp. SE-J8 TaxID=3054952 RepID=UPI00259D003D|nr:AEC family transporter [Galbitalea sp. SE-J8]MDM4762268.1 AEC family transporter [Galbitalea sp. SE-J8]